MRLFKRRLGSDRSGQLLIVAALIIAVLICSTTIYVYEIDKETNNINNISISDIFLALKQSTKNVMISSLANVSNGGEKTILKTNLNTLSQILRSLHQHETCCLWFTLKNDSNYDSGVWLSWDTKGFGVSSVYANFTLKVYNLDTNITAPYALNVTTATTLNGYYTNLTNDEKRISLRCNVYNEENSALAKNINIFYESSGSWMPVDSSNNPSIEDYGNGTYLISFTLNTPSEAVETSVHVYDFHDIFVQANTTCYEA